MKQIKDELFACKGLKCKPEQDQKPKTTNPKRPRQGGPGGRKHRGFNEKNIVPNDRRSKTSENFGRRTFYKPRGRRGDHKRHKNRYSKQPAHVATPTSHMF